MSEMKSDLTAEFIRSIIHYDPETGIVTRLDGKAITKTYGRYITKINGSIYKVHRLIWVYMTGEWPIVFIDHEDKNPSNNRWSNLRLANQSQNHQNGTNKNPLGYKGVLKEGDKYRARIYVNEKRINLGYFSSIEEAGEAYMRAAKKYFGEYATYG